MTEQPMRSSEEDRRRKQRRVLRVLISDDRHQQECAYGTVRIFLLYRRDRPDRVESSLSVLWPTSARQQEARGQQAGAAGL